MTTVAEMIEWMKTLPQDAEVECGVEVQCSYSTYMSFQPVQIDYCTVFDYKSEEDRAKYPARAGKTFVHIEGG
jgi:hypothetical protein